MPDMRKPFLYILYFFSAIVLVFSFSCSKDSIPSTITGKWKLILQGNDNASHRIDTFSLTRTNDSVLQEFITFNNDDSTGTIELKGMGLDSGSTYSYMDSTYRFSWIYFNSGPEIWIRLEENPHARFKIWTSADNIHLHVNYQDNMYFCDYYPVITGSYPYIQQVFQKQ